MKKIFKIIPLAVLATWFSLKWIQAQEVKKELPKLKQNGAQMIDVRTPEEFNDSKVIGTFNIPLSEFESRLKEIDKSKPVVVCCKSGHRSGQAKSILEKNGYKDVLNAGSCNNLSNP